MVMWERKWFLARFLRHAKSTQSTLGLHTPLLGRLAEPL
eukprot:CAMPEP_0171630602 /NCGR_PEP_ID=MMETSP0990-20121206/23041_1 /TAXON_ID=483369 /ORGANISM="non described non described, Strain CCMP2098" /LENGTH=38 /DNA_ID= /DNA_START= /DNA_END= /DNA_ORIENTATION=